MDQVNDSGAAADDLDAAMRESGETSAALSRERADRFYDRMRSSIRQYLDRKGKLAGKTGEYLLLAPDVFVLLWRLVNDGRVNTKNKMLLGSGLAYYLFPLDLMPEGFMGPVGYLDDLVFGVYLLNKILADTDPAVLRQHWSGSEDVLQSIKNVLNAAENLVGKDIFGRLKKAIK